MPRSVTLATLLADLADATDEAAFDSSSYITKAQATRYLSWACHAFALQHRGFGLLSSTSTFTTASGTRSYALPSDFAALKYLTYEYQGEPQPIFLKPLEDVDLAARANAQAWGCNSAVYCLEGEAIITNDPKGVFTVTLRYVPELPMRDTNGVSIADFSADTDILYCKTSIDQWVVLDAAIRVARKNSQDPSLFIAARQDIEATLRESVTDRETVHSQAVTNAWDRRNLQW